MAGKATICSSSSPYSAKEERKTLYADDLVRRFRVALKRSRLRRSERNVVRQEGRGGLPTIGMF